MTTTAVKIPLLLFRVVAYVVGLLLLTLAFVAMPLKYLAQSPELVSAVAPAHGTVYLIYVAVCLELGRRARWGLRRTALVALAGTVPVFSFAAERAVVREFSHPTRASHPTTESQPQ